MQGTVRTPAKSTNAALSGSCSRRGFPPSSPCRPDAGSVARFDSARYCSYLRLMSAHRELQRIKLAAATIEPCLPRKAKVPPSGADWLHEIKHDGFRILAQTLSVMLVTSTPGATG